MPKESACVGERVTPGTNKNGKDRSNSAALQTTRGRAGIGGASSGRDSSYGSEKDSGYSDTGSDSLQTDVEEQQSQTRKHWAGARGLGRGPEGRANQTQLTPFYILKNVVVKQPLTLSSGQDQLIHSQLAWPGGSLSSPAPTPLLFIQQPSVTTTTWTTTWTTSATTSASLASSLPPVKPHANVKSSRSSSSSYLPILNSYPRIAPQPCRKAVEKEKGKSGSGEEQSLSKRVCVEDRREVRPTLDPPPPTTLSSPSVSSSDALGAAPSHPSRRQRRFLNTVEILSRSGLLDITLRTQQLQRRSAATERDIAQLRQHAQLLLQAAQASPDCAPHAWDTLCHAMTQSGCYPGLAPAEPRGCITVTCNDLEACPPSPLLAPSPHPPPQESSET